MSWLRKHWGNIIGVFGPLLGFLDPSIRAYATAHPKTALGVIMGALLLLFNSSAPKDFKQLHLNGGSND